MKPAKFSMGQKVWAVRDVGRWGEPTGFQGMIVGIQTSYTSGSHLYTIKTDSGTVDVWEGKLSEYNDPNWTHPLLGC